MKLTHEINKIQSHIIHSLFNSEPLGFAALNKNYAPSDQFSYHLRQLLKQNLIKKVEGKYTLTTYGIDRAIMLDKYKSGYIKQGFIAVRIVVSRRAGNKNQYLIQKRSRIPYTGRLSEPGGKILYGENILDAASRNLRVETGISAKLKVKGLVHIQDSYHSELVQDKFFFVAKGDSDLKGLSKTGPSGENLWMTLDELIDNPKTLPGAVEIIKIAESDTTTIKEFSYEANNYSFGDH